MDIIIAQSNMGINLLHWLIDLQSEIGMLHTKAIAVPMDANMKPLLVQDEFLDVLDIITWCVIHLSNN